SYSSAPPPPGLSPLSLHDALPISIHVPDQPPIETRLTEGTGNLPMCAIARLVNQNGSINVERINQYFKGHQEMDKAFNWGFSWKDRKSTRLNSSHVSISYAVFCLK